MSSSRFIVIQQAYNFMEMMFIEWTAALALGKFVVDSERNVRLWTDIHYRPSCLVTGVAQYCSSCSGRRPQRQLTPLEQSRNCCPPEQLSKDWS